MKGWKWEDNIGRRVVVLIAVLLALTLSGWTWDDRRSVYVESDGATVENIDEGAWGSIEEPPS